MDEIDPLADLLDFIMGPNPYHRRANGAMVERAIEELAAEQERATRLGDENARLRAALRAIRRIWMESEATYEEDCADMANIAFASLERLGEGKL